MPEVGITARAQQFDTVHAVAEIRSLCHLRRIKLAMKTGPAATRVEFALGTEQGVPTTNTFILAFFGMVAILPAERRLGARFAGNAVLFGIKLCLPFLGAPGDFFHSICHCNVSCGSQIEYGWI